MLFCSYGMSNGIAYKYVFVNEQQIEGRRLAIFEIPIILLLICTSTDTHQRSQFE